MPFRHRPMFSAILLTFPVFAGVSHAFAAPTVATPEVEITSESMHLLPSLTNIELNDAALDQRRANTSDTAALLDEVPGISLQGAGGVSSLPAIHGLADDRLRIKVDGMDLIASCPNHMNPALSYIDPTHVSKLNVYAGIAPVSSGGDSIGGTIIAETKAPEFAAPGQGNLIKGQIGAFYRSNNDAQGGNMSATFATENVSVRYDGAISKADNYTAGGNFKNSLVTGRTGHTLPLDEVGSTAYETRNHALGLAFKSGRHLFEAKLGFQDLPEQGYPNQRMDMLDNQQKRINLRYLGEFEWGALEARAYHEDVDHYMNFGDDKQLVYGTAVSGMPMSTRGRTSGATLKADIALSAQDLLHIGGEVQRYRLDDWWDASGTGMMSPNAFLNINNGERDRIALFSEWEKQLDAQWRTLAGIRYEHVRTDAGNVNGYDSTNAMGSNQSRDSAAFNAQNHQHSDDNWDMTALAHYTRDANMELEFGVARKVRSPNLYERYTWSTWQMAAIMNNTAGDGNGYFGNVNLKPEKAHTLSATLDWHAADRDWDIKATPYFTHVTDYIDAVQWNSASNTASATPVKNQFTVLRYTNQTAHLYGLDLSGHMSLAHTEVGHFGLQGLFNYTRGQNLDTHDDLYNIMPLNARLTLTHQYDRWDNGLELVMVSDKNHVSDMRNEIKTPGYSLVNLHTSYAWKQVRVHFGIENLFDKQYSLPLGGAYVGQGSTMAMNPSMMSPNAPTWGTAVPGMGRSINVGMTIDF